MTLITLGVYVSVDQSNMLDAKKAFVSVSLFNILKAPRNLLPQIISSLVQVTPGRAGGSAGGRAGCEGQGTIQENYWNSGGGQLA